MDLRGVYAAPRPPPDVPIGEALGRDLPKEAIYTTYDWSNFDPGAVQTIGQTRGAWRGVDVYVIPPQVTYASQDALHFVIYALTTNVERVPIGSGFYELGSPFTLVIAPRRVATARAVCERFEVDVKLLGPTGVVPVPANGAVTIVAHNEVIESSIVGTMRRNDVFTGFVRGAQNTRFFGIRGFNDSGATRFVQVFDKIAAPAAASTPIWSFPVAAGASFEVYPPEAESYWFQNGIFIRTSSTFGTYTIVAAIPFQAWLR